MNTYRTITTCLALCLAMTTTFSAGGEGALQSDNDKGSGARDAARNVAKPVTIE